MVVLEKNWAEEGRVTKLFQCGIKVLDQLADMAVPQGCSTWFTLQIAHRVKEMCRAMRLPVFNELCDLQMNSTCSAWMFSASVLRDVQFTLIAYLPLTAGTEQKKFLLMWSDMMGKHAFAQTLMSMTPRTAERGSVENLWAAESIY